MELIVWINGIPRSVSGITFTTTCEDVIMALANATEQTGRFIIIIKLAHTEWSLPPWEFLLKALQKCNEYAEEIHWCHSSKNKARKKETVKWADTGPQSPVVCCVDISSDIRYVDRFYTTNRTLSIKSYHNPEHFNHTKKHHRQKICRPTVSAGCVLNHTLKPFVSSGSTKNCSHLDIQSIRQEQKSLSKQIHPVDNTFRPIEDKEQNDVEINYPDILRDSKRIEQQQNQLQLAELVTCQFEKIKSQESQIDMIDAEIASLERKEHDAEDELANLQKMYKDKENKIILEIESASWKEKLFESQQLAVSIKDEISSLQNKIHSFETSLNKAKQEEKKISENIKQWEAHQSSVLHDINTHNILLQEIEEMKEKLKDKQKNCDNIEIQLKDLNEKIQTLEIKFQEYENQITTLQSQIDEES